jgi:hypothetical protein
MHGCSSLRYGLASFPSWSTCDSLDSDRESSADGARTVWRTLARQPLATERDTLWERRDMSPALLKPSRTDAAAATARGRLPRARRPRPTRWRPARRLTSAADNGDGQMRMAPSGVGQPGERARRSMPDDPALVRAHSLAVVAQRYAASAWRDQPRGSARLAVPRRRADRSY